MNSLLNWILRAIALGSLLLWATGADYTPPEWAGHHFWLVMATIYWCSSFGDH